MTGNVLGLDLGTHCGWAILDENGAIVGSGVWAFGGASGDRFLTFFHMLDMIAKKADAIAYEDVRRHLGTTAAHVYGGFLAVVQIYASHTGKLLYPIGVGVVKKHATGKGNAKKFEMVAAARSRWPIDFQSDDDNEADALFVADLGRSERERAVA